MKIILALLFSSLCLAPLSAQVTLNFDNGGTTPPNEINFTGFPISWIGGDYTLDTVETLNEGTSENTLSANYQGTNGYLNIITYPPGLPAPWVGSELIFNDGLRELLIKLDGTSVAISGHDEDGNWVDYNGWDGWSASYEGGGFGPAYLSGGAFVEHAEELNVGLTFTNGQWAPTP